MKVKSILVILLISFLWACNKSDAESNCIDAQLESRDMVPYTGTSLDCHFFLEMYSFEGNDYFSVNNHCIDMIITYEDCSGIDICREGNTFECNKFEANRQYLGIVGIGL